MNDNFPYGKWYLEFTEEQRPIVDNWRINIIKFSSEPCPTQFINYQGWGGFGDSRIWGADLNKITFEQFEQYVLKKSLNPILENYDYLIPILTNL